MRQKYVVTIEDDDLSAEDWDAVKASFAEALAEFCADNGGTYEEVEE